MVSGSGKDNRDPPETDGSFWKSRVESSSMKICMVASEATPFAKTGGLADVSSALTRALSAAGHDARLFLPMYAKLRSAGYKFSPVPEVQDIEFEFGGERARFSLSTLTLPESDAPVYFVRCPELFDTEALYPDDGRDHLRFALFSRAVLETCQRLGWGPDVVHCNDWHIGLLPLYLEVYYGWDELFKDTKTLLTIHNIGYQGLFPVEHLKALGLEDQKHLLYQEDVKDGVLSFLKTGLLYADLLSTVSETYAHEIQTEEYGMGLEQLLAKRADSLTGIVNGVDLGEWSPATDKLIPHNFTHNKLGGKTKNKRALSERLGLEFDERAAVLGIVSRLTWQKGFELLPDVLPVLLRRKDVRLAILGSGDEKYEKYFAWLQEMFPGQVGFHCGYDESLAHLVEAGSDMFIMPSRYEPCGLNQMYSLAYGTVPVVRNTGGLADTVRENEQDGTGFCFDQFDSPSLLQALERALESWSDPKRWRALMLRGMAQDYSWERQAKHYIDLYGRLQSPAKSN